LRLKASPHRLGAKRSELEDLIDRYNSLVSTTQKRVAYRFVFTVITVGLTLTGALLGNPVFTVPVALAAASSGLSLVRFATLENSPVVTAGEAEPAAMFHDVESKI
jgi:hypothetical protein